ncbi:Glutaredoxin,Thioredoxin-like fold,Monothiol glutaredoxin,Glutaredoxin, PICOT-like,Monothiol [Cinara cedri]|uniref:Glutaredoxin-related protein 5, mitochondrial n=1 Tax=Cinara cedri TaxID=506608 RepID=A0A5E4NK05_9HEMI|nr:Glutaredoxin,Thioredoxin-like fold,Monothiol glutaredoxin,Glutaredoxin, PICOT-like,Monothiol [Cinara cedri]
MSLFRQITNIIKTTQVDSFKVLCSKFLSTKNDDPVQSYIDKLVKNHKVVVFMKGDPQAPRCGFSNAVVDILSIHKTKFEALDVLKDENLRNGIKEYSNWPTIPQVFVNGEFIGGCDIMLQLHRSGELDRILNNNKSDKDSQENPVV